MLRIRNIYQLKNEFFRVLHSLLHRRGWSSNRTAMLDSTFRIVGRNRSDHPVRRPSPTRTGRLFFDRLRFRTDSKLARSSHEIGADLSGRSKRKSELEDDHETLQELPVSRSAAQDPQHSVLRQRVENVRRSKAGTVFTFQFLLGVNAYKKLCDSTNF